MKKPIIVGLFFMLILTGCGKKVSTEESVTLTPEKMQEYAQENESKIETKEESKSDITVLTFTKKGRNILQK